MHEGLTILIVGSGAREHAISYAYEKSDKVKKIIIAPGNDFIAYQRKKEVIIDKDCNVKQPHSFLDLARKYKPDLIDVAQDDAIAAGTVDLLRKHGFLVFGPTQQAARIEWDKQWSREFMKRYDIPCPKFQYFSDHKKAKEYVTSLYQKNPKKLLYIKAAGLCEGKGALKTTCLKEALLNIERMKEFKEAGNFFLIEDGLVGEEFSYYAISDGESYSTFISAQDHKTVFDFDRGEQTGGMGAIAPTEVTKPFSQDIEKKLIARAIHGMQREKTPFVGILYLGGIISNNEVMNIEYNARWGDPECQVILPSLQTDYIDLIMACLQKRLSSIKIQQDKKIRVCVVGASKGYPRNYSSVVGKRIYGIEKVMPMKGITFFGAGIAVRNGNFYANGGRLFNIIGEGNTLLEARERAYQAMKFITIEGNNLHYRTDIGLRGIERSLKIE